MVVLETSENWRHKKWVSQNELDTWKSGTNAPDSIPKQGGSWEEISQSLIPRIFCLCFLLIKSNKVPEPDAKPSLSLTNFNQKPINKKLKMMSSVVANLRRNRTGYRMDLSGVRLQMEINLHIRIAKCPLDLKKIGIGNINRILYGVHQVTAAWREKVFKFIP